MDILIIGKIVLVLREVTPMNKMTTDKNDIMFDLTRFYILMILYEGPIHGYGIKNEFERRLGKSISFSLIYPFLKKLQTKGIVEQKSIKKGLKVKKVFSLTPKGKTFCDSLFQRFSSIVETAIEPQLDACTNCGTKLYHGGYKATYGKKELIFCCKHCARMYKRQNHE